MWVRGSLTFEIIDASWYIARPPSLIVRKAPRQVCTTSIQVRIHGLLVKPKEAEVNTKRLLGGFGEKNLYKTLDGWLNCRVGFNREEGMLCRDSRADVRWIILLRLGDRERIEVVRSARHVAAVYRCLLTRVVYDSEEECNERRVGPVKQPCRQSVLLSNRKPLKLRCRLRVDMTNGPLLERPQEYAFGCD